MAVDTSEVLKKLDSQISQLQARKKAIEKMEKQKAKKERTHRLIQYGELVEKYLQCETLEQLEEFLKTHSQPGEDYEKK